MVYRLGVLIQTHTYNIYMSAMATNTQNHTSFNSQLHI